jgi:hypothetical protein
VNRIETKANTSPLRPLLLSFAMAGIVGFLSVILSTFPVATHDVARALRRALFLVPSVGRLSGSMTDPEAGEVILSTQWLFAPIYIFFWFYCLPPWGPLMRASAQTKGRTLTDAQRWILLPLGFLVLCAWILGDIGVIGFPTLYNGKIVYPVEGGVMQLKYIYTSPIALALYAWFGPICEATVLWMLSHLVINARAFFSPERPTAS